MGITSVAAVKAAEISFLSIYSNGLIHTLLGGGEVQVSPWLLLGLFLLCAVSGYLLGSLNAAMILSKIMYHEDIRNFGSGNAGSTNMMRQYGKKAAILTFCLDILKAGVAVWISILLLGQNGAYIGGAFCVLGHCYPIFYHFKGGKGVAVAAAICLFTNPPIFLILLIVFVIIVSFTKYISLGSIMALLMFPLLLNSYYKMIGTVAPLTVLMPALFITVFVIWQHRDNIKRLRAGEENRFSFRKSEKSVKQKSRDAHREEHEDLDEAGQQNTKSGKPENTEKQKKNE